MRKSKTLAKLRAGQPVRMCSLGHFFPAFIAHAAKAGYDCIWFDLEHREMDAREVQAALAYFHLYDIDCMLRPPTLEKTRLYRYLEDGATGLMIPHVASAEQAKWLVNAVKFPPLGDRGLDAAGLDSNFMLGELETYVDHANRETFLIVQIETPEAVGNVEQIAAVPGVDGMFVGPGDLGLRIRRNETGLDLDDVFKTVARVAKQHNTAWGCPAGSIEQLQHFRDLGAQLVSHGGDFRAMMDCLNLCASEFDKVDGPR